MANMHLLYFLDLFPDPYETFITDQIYVLLKKGWKITVIRLSVGDAKPSGHLEFVMKNIELIDWPDLKPREIIGIIKNLVKLGFRQPLRTAKILFLQPNGRRLALRTVSMAACFKNSVDAVHAHFANLNAAYASSLAEWLDVPFTFTMHGYDIRDLPIGREGLLNACKKSSDIITVSSACVKALTNLGIPTRKIKLLYCGVFPSELRPTARHLLNERLNIITIARLHPIKSHSTLLEALKIIDDAGIDFTLTLVGDGELHDQISDFASQLGIFRKVKFMGACTHEKTLELLNSPDCNVHVLPSENESLSVANLEAMAAGLIVVASRVGGLPEVINHGVNGFLFQRKNSTELAEILKYIHQHPELSDSMGRAARERASNDFDIDKISDEFVKIVTSRAIS